ncbi:uncharacterized protein si:dkey-127k13.1 [Danio rerio]|uniref:Uncharacterized protein si:dkey-127k13.1 n=1 Tax=Danio rerio TaxID=7955 RepID=A0A8M1PVE2_DANRE
MVAGMSSSDESLKRQRNPHRTCRTDSTQVNEPVSGGTESITHNKRTTAPQDLILVKSCGRRATENKPQAANQNAPPCLRKSRHQVTNINGCVSKKSHQPEQVLPRKIATPKYQIKTAYKGRRKKNVEASEKKVAASKAKLDVLDNLCSEQHLSSQKPKRTHHQNSKRTQNHQTPSDVSTGVYTCTTLSPCRCKEDSCCHTNRPQAPLQDRLQFTSLLSSTSNSDLKSLSPQTGQNSCVPHSEPDVLKSSLEKRPPTDASPSPQRARGRPKGNNNKVQEDPSSFSPVKHSRESTECPVEYPKRFLHSSSDLQCLSPQTAENSFAPNNHQNARKSSLKKRPPADALPSPQRARGRPKRNNNKVQEDPSSSSPVKHSRESTECPVEYPKRFLHSSSDLQCLSPQTAENTCAPNNYQNARKSRLKKRPPADALPSPQRARGRPKGSKNKKVQERPSASPSEKYSRKHEMPLVESCSQKHLSSPWNSHLQPLKPKTDDNSFAPYNDPNARESQQEKRPPADASSSTPSRPRAGPKGSTTKKIQKKSSISPPVKCSRKFTECLAASHTPKQKRLQSSPLLSSTPSSHHLPLIPLRADNNPTPNATKSRLKKRPPADASPSTPQRPRGRPKGSMNKKVQEGASVSPPVKRSRKFTECLAESHTPKQKRLKSSPLLSSTPSSHLQPLTSKREDNNPAPNATKSRLEKRPPADASPSTPQRTRGRSKGSTNKKVQEGASVSPPVKRSRKSTEFPAEMQTLSSPCSENQEPEPNESDQTMSSDLSIELSLHEDPHLLNHSLFMQEEKDDQDDDDDDEELPSFLGQDSKKPLSISEGLCVWCKMWKYPYWPAVVKSVNRKNKKASIIFIDCDLSDQKRAKKGFTVSLRNLKPFDCEDYEKLVDMAKEKYGSAITWSVELISDYRIRIGCGSFSGSFIEYCAADISCPVRRKYSEGKSVLTFPSQEILGEKCDISENSAEDICAEDQDELLSQKRNLPDRAKAARTRANEQLVDFIIRGKVENHLLAIISESSAWMQALQKPFRQVVCPVLYLEDEGQVDKVYQYLHDLCETAPQINTSPENVQVVRVRLILDVLLPKAIIYAIAGVHNLSLEKAEEKYHKGPRFSNRERQEFDMMIERQMKLKEITQRHRR